jgi:hypothetical protein
LLPVASYAYETWLLKFKEENRLRVSEDRVWRGIFGPKREEVKFGCKEVRNEELQNLYSLVNIIRVIKSRSMRWVERVAHMAELRNAYKI